MNRGHLLSKSGQTSVFRKLFLYHLGYTNNWFLGCFDVFSTHISPYKFLESLKEVHFGTDAGSKEGQNTFFKK